MSGCVDWYKMKLGDFQSYGPCDSIRRVPGGWVVGNMQGCCFVPFNNEFMESGTQENSCDSLVNKLKDSLNITKD